MSTVTVDRMLVAAGAGLVSLAFLACGGAPPPRGIDQAFEEIQVHEAIIERRIAEVERCAADEACPARVALCDAAGSICAIAEELDDDDARARCDAARRRCPPRRPPETGA